MNNEWKKIPNVEQVLWLSEDEQLDQEILDATYKELDNLREHDVFEKVGIKENSSKVSYLQGGDK